MSLSGRDRKIVMLLVPVALVAAFWFLALAPKRQEQTKVKDELTQAQSQRDTAQQSASQLGGAKRNFAADYATVISLGKSIPTSVDMPSLLVQLDTAAKGTGIRFVDVKTGERSGTGSGSPSGSSAPAPSAPAPSAGTGPTAPGAAPAQSGPGKAAQSAGNAANQSNSSSTAAGLPAGSPPASTGAAGGTSSPAGLDNVPLDFEFKGSFMNLADFFHRMKRFVRVANNQIVVQGRLIVINSFSFDTQNTVFPVIDAKVHATVYLAPKGQGVSAGATPQGPAGASSPTQPASTGSTSIPPAATVTAP